MLTSNKVIDAINQQIGNEFNRLCLDAGTGCS